MLLPHLFPNGMITDKTLGKRAVFLPSSCSVNSSIPLRFNSKLHVLIQIHKRPHLVALHFWGRHNLLLKIEQTSYHTLTWAKTRVDESQLLAHKRSWNDSAGALFIKLSHMNCWYLRSNYQHTSLLVKEEYLRNVPNDYESIKSLLGTSDDLVCIQGNRNASLQACCWSSGISGWGVSKICHSQALADTLACLISQMEMPDPEGTARRLSQSEVPPPPLSLAPMISGSPILEDGVISQHWPSDHLWDRFSCWKYSK